MINHHLCSQNDLLLNFGEMVNFVNIQSRNKIIFYVVGKLNSDAAMNLFQSLVKVRMRETL